MVAKTIKKAQKGAKTPAKKSPPMRVFTEADYRRKDSVPSEMFPGTMIPRSKSNYHSGEFDKMFEKPKPKSAPKKKMMHGGMMEKAKSGKSFPDLTGDGKVTRADILKGRGVIKNGGKLKKQAAIAIAMKKAGKKPKK